MLVLVVDREGPQWGKCKENTKRAVFEGLIQDLGKIWVWWRRGANLG